MYFLSPWSRSRYVASGPLSLVPWLTATVSYQYIQVFNRAVPFGDLSSFMAMLAITQGKRPPRPTHPAFTENLWGLVQRCWDHNPHLRPEVSEVSQGLLTTSVPFILADTHPLIRLLQQNSHLETVGRPLPLCGRARTRNDFYLF